jgi:HAMP domain-containing protein
MIKQFNRLRIQSKLIVAFGIVTIVGALALGVNIFSTFQMENEANNMFRQVQKLYNAHEMVTFLLNMDLNGRAIFDRGVLSNREMHVEYSTQMNDYLQDAMVAADSAYEIERVQILIETKQNYDLAFSTALKELIVDQSQANPARYDEALTIMKDSFTMLREETLAFIGMMENEMQKANERVRTYATVATVLGGFALVLFTGMAFLAAYLVSSQVHRPLIDIEDAIHAARDGTFDAEALAGMAERTDELGRLARQLTSMVDAAEARQTVLKGKLEELKGELDRRTAGKVKEGV